MAEKKSGFLSRIVEKMDKGLESKAQESCCSCCCAHKKGREKDKGCCE
jgi:hypothetical protein